MLDIIYQVLLEEGMCSCRIDGSTPAVDRQRIIDSFNHSIEDRFHGQKRRVYTGGINICLLSTKACGTGITLTGADRVIMFDPSWNPAEDRYFIMCF